MQNKFSCCDGTDQIPQCVIIGGQIENNKLSRPNQTKANSIADYFFYKLTVLIRCDIGPSGMHVHVHVLVLSKSSGHYTWY